MHAAVRRGLVVVALPTAALAATVTMSCREATEITIVLSTDVPCSDMPGSTVTVGRLGDIEAKAPTTSSTFCDAASGDLGSLVIVPSAGDSDEVAVKIVAGHGRDPASCVAPGYGKGCIVARRAIRFVPHTALRLAVPLHVACDGIACGFDQTCVAGACVSAVVSDPSACSTPEGCGEGTLVPPPVSDGGDAGVAEDGPTDGEAGTGDAALTFHPMTNLTLWSKVRLTSLSPTATLFSATAFDGRYLYLAPDEGGGTDVVRYDTRGPFDPASFTLFDLTAMSPRLRGFGGALFDGRFVYLVGHQNRIEDGGASDGLFARYDTQSAFTSASSWSTFDATTVAANARGFLGSTFDGRYAYFTPNQLAEIAAGFVPGGVATRYDTQAPFASAASWTAYDQTQAIPATTGYSGGAFDGRYVYWAPIAGPSAPSGAVGRYDTAGAGFIDKTAWSAFDVTSVNAAATSFAGLASDGTFLYLVPARLTNNAPVVRYDTRAPFATAASWSAFDLAGVSPNGAHAGGVFDGRYFYVVPYSASALLLRYDTEAPFGTASSWSTFDLTKVDANAFGFQGGAFDGRYLYLTPQNGVFLRFEATSASITPPNVHGSFF
jgi:hypothetical protein